MKPSRIVLAQAMSIAVVAALLGQAAPAFAQWRNTRFHQYHFREVNNTGGNVNDNHIRIMSRSSGGNWTAPELLGTFMLRPATWAFIPPAVVVGNALVVSFAGPVIPPGGDTWKNVYIRVPGEDGPWESVAFFQWTLDGQPVGGETALGFCISPTSPPVKIGNPSVRPDGSTNTSNMVVRNLKFAQSPEYIPNDELTLENPAAIALFAASPDPERAGPFTATPGTCLEFSPAMHSSILPPQGLGRSVLAKGTVEDGSGNQYDFVVQFTPSTVLPGVSPPGVIVLVVLLLAVSAVWFARTRGRKGADAVT